MPCCWMAVGVEPVVAMVEGEQRGEEGAGCWVEEVEVASYSLEGAADLGRGERNLRFNTEW